MKLTVFGTGYVGLVQATILADAGHTVCCVDKDESKIAKLKEGIVPIYEPGLSALVKKITKPDDLSLQQMLLKVSLLGKYNSLR